MGIGRQVVNIELFTDAYRVTARALVPGAGGIHAALSDINTDYLDLEEAYVSRIHQPGDIIGSSTHGAFRKDNINFIVMQDRRDGVPIGTSHGYSIYSRGRPMSVFLTVPSFEITGEVFYDGKASPAGVIVQTIGRFLPIFVAKASASLVPEISYSGDLILIHKEHIGVFCLDPGHA
jgi:hypothetical protein